MTATQRVSKKPPSKSEMERGTNPNGNPFALTINSGSLPSGAQGETSKASLYLNPERLVTKKIPIPKNWTNLRKTIDIELELKSSRATCTKESHLICFVGVAGAAVHKAQFSATTPYYTIDAADYIYLLYQYIDGENLVTNNSGVPTTIAVIRQLLEAVKVLHDNDIAHRDIKLDNCMIDKAPKIYLIDFGDLCKNGDCSFAKVTGTELYLPLEGYLIADTAGQLQALCPTITEDDIIASRGLRRDPRPIDVFALGCTLFALVKKKHMLEELYKVATGGKSIIDDKGDVRTIPLLKFLKLYYTSDNLNRFFDSMRKDKSVEEQSLLTFIQKLVDPDSTTRITIAAALAEFTAMFPPAAGGGRRWRKRRTRRLQRQRQRQQQRQQQRQRQSRRSFQT